MIFFVKKMFLILFVVYFVVVVVAAASVFVEAEAVEENLDLKLKRVWHVLIRTAVKKHCDLLSENRLIYRSLITFYLCLLLL